jgi:peptidoglycan/LPS O-acetylase OafA/YrhL
LSVEEWFYISLPLGVLLAFIIPAKNKENRLLMVFLLLLCLFTYARFTQFQGQFELSAWDKNIRKVVAFRLDALMYGVLAAWFFKTKTQLVLPFKNTLLIVGMLLVPLAYFIFYKKYFPFFNVVFFTSISSLGFALSLFSFANWKGPKNIKLVNGITYLSVISYSLYLIHYTFLFRILNNFIIASTLLNASVLFVSYLLLSIILASLFHYYFEKPFLKMKEKMNA